MQYISPPNLKIKLYEKLNLTSWRYPNHWDAIALSIVLTIIALFALAAKSMSSPYHLGDPIIIHLEPAYLPYYAFRSVIRMALALVLSLIFTFVVGTAAAKSKNAARFIIPLIDILQSVPVVGYLSVMVVAFIALFPNSILGPECAAIFAIFTAQVWNMALSFYQSLSSIPNDLKEAADSFQLSAWQKFWKLEVPFAMPGLLWNTMMSMSASWFFVVASEAITVNQQNIALPGIGSYIAIAVERMNLTAVTYAIVTMLFVILLYDQILFRPLNEWIKKFKFEQTAAEESSSSWIVLLFRRTQWMRHTTIFFTNIWDSFVNCPLLLKKPSVQVYSYKRPSRYYDWIWNSLLMLVCVVSFVMLGRFVFSSVTFTEAIHVFYLGGITGLRVLALIVISSLIWIPVGVWIGKRPRTTQVVQPFIQFLASFPANLIYPVVVIAIVKWNLNPNIWISPLMILGAQWYILFNVIAGFSALPKELQQTADSFNVKGLLWWRRLALPGIFPYYVTGAITASGGAWNASVVAEILNWGSTKIEVAGLGAYIANQTAAGDFPRVALGIGVMCIYVLVINHLLWRPLYRFASARFGIA